MFWDFLKKKPAAAQPARIEKLHKPQEMVEAVGRDLIVKMGKNPDWVWHLKCVVRRKENEKSLYDIRVFDEAQAARAEVRVRDYTSLDDHPDLILFHGWFDKKSGMTHIEEGAPPEPVTKPA
jgi:hypothetical protein